jgi:glycosyltransferase involved in cell wall biosynthesis
MAMSESILISVITPTYKARHKIAPTVESVLSQGESQIEHIIVDGASGDGIDEVVERYARDSPYPIRFLSEPDTGVYDAMNKGIALAGGRYLYFLGAGDKAWPGAFLKILPMLPTQRLAMVYGDIMCGGLWCKGPFNRLSLQRGNICHQAIFYSRETFDVLGLYDGKYPRFADWEFNLRCFGCPAVRCQYIPMLVADYEGGGVSGEGDRAFEADREFLIRRHLGLGMLLLGRVDSLFWRSSRAIKRRLVSVLSTVPSGEL